ncbi:MAG: BamA/TamA family outer membrane protein [Synechococcales cyanobacterium SupBloom_Metag_052]|nr:BamA/TamA family outer membrane protein [Synechococcales cyanobacterium SupBloom_Metag_052]
MAGLLHGRNRPNRFGGPLGLAASLPLLAASLVTPGQAATGAASQTQSAPASSPAAASSPSAAAPTLQPGAPKPGVGKPGLAKPAAAPAPGSAAPTASQAPEAGAPSEPKVLISEVVVKGLQQHPERERLELAVYDAMATRPGTQVTRSELRNDLSAIYASGWFSDVRIQPQDGPLGVRLLVTVEPNPVLTKVELEGGKAKLPATLIPDTFASDYGKTLNLNTLQGRLQDLQKWYSDQGYSLARVTGPSKVTPQGVVQLTVREGTVAGVEIQFVDKEGSPTNAKGQPIKGKTRLWVVNRELATKPGDSFNRRRLEEDIKRLYGTGLFGDVKVTLKPLPESPGTVTIVLGITEQSTGALSGGLGYSQSQGVFGQVQLSDSNLGGRAWDTTFNFTYGQYGGLADISFTDPWIKGDKYRTAFRARIFLSREVPQIFQSQSNGSFNTVSNVSSGFYSAPSTAAAYNIYSSTNPGATTYNSVEAARAANPGNNWFALDGNLIAVQRVGANLQLVRPLNGGNPFKKAPWSLVVGLSIQEATPMNFSGQTMPYGVATTNFNGGSTTTSNVICIAYNCANSNQLFGLRVAATRNTLNDPRNPTAGNFLSVGTEQFVSVGPDSPTFNRVRASYTQYYPVNWLRVYKGCRPKKGEAADCKQALAFQLSAGANVGTIPPYEAFCLGGSNSVRGFYDCNMGVGTSYGEATIEYRFPIFSIISGELFADAGTDFGTQGNVPGNPGGVLGKPGSGFSVGTGIILSTPVGPLRLEVASQDFTSNWRFNLGVGWKF